MAARNWRSLVRTALNLSDEDRRRLLDDVYRVIKNWRGPLPTHKDLLRICPAEQIEGFLAHVVTDEDGKEEARKRFIEFVVETGYKDEPGVARNDLYLQQVRRTTPIHLALRVKFNDWDGMVRLLFQIYDKFDLNYVDENGLTHFHAVFGLADNRHLVKMFIANGHDPNIMTGDYSLIRQAVFNNDEDMAADLMSRGGDPTRVDEDGSTALHILCRNSHKYLLELFFMLVDEGRRNVRVNVYDRSGDTPLHLAAKHCSPETIDKLLRLGADPNLADSDGCTALHLLCMRFKSHRALTKFFHTCDALRLQVNINAKNNEGRTPLNLFCYLNRGNHAKPVELLQNRGACHW
uniref:Uncharacterized protein n=1 Tax=Trichogramma kaykai TaxID=54128 RepID=A0ABD2WJ29_9HYME